ncbi:efflux RND transporter periplasmic adaptor subunit [Spirochaetes bacterium]|uniref:Efflux RND transporter periplasmic adaptor subunit n=1 Tax=Candidatus Scatousia excrementipullorum TaxID=2840936 RepID=A0A9D9DR54_9BACT|nr:efflux RND transporter periplasmic adaptor subunit [Candidatus Scatousia excrementipullorum]
MKKNIIIIIAIIIAAVLFRYGFNVYDNIRQGRMSKNKKAPEVTVTEIHNKEIIRSFEAPGRVVSKYQVNVLARISGYLQKSYFKEGDFVKAGQTLFLIEPQEFSNAANVAKADVENTRAQLVYAEKQLARAKELVAKDYIAKSQYDNLLAQRDSLKAQLASAEARYNDTNRSLGYTHVKAPVEGRIGIITVTLGNYVTPSSGPLTTINSTDPIYVTFPLDSADFNALSNADGADHKNRKTEIYFSNGQKYPFNGEQDFHDNKIDQSTGTVTMRATFQNPNNQLLHGEFVTVKLYSNNPVETPVVPQTAVQENQAGKYVYRIDEQNLPQLVYIKIGGQTGTDWIVEEGLKAGDRIVIDGLQKVVPGQPVTIKTADQKDLQPKL